MLTRLFFILVTSIFFSSGYSQSCHSYYPMNEGARWVMETYDYSNELATTSIQSVKDASSANGVYTAHMQGEVLDNENKAIGAIDYQVKCQDGNFYISMGSFLNPEQMNAYQDMEVEIDGDFLELPSELKPGASLPDASIEVRIQASGEPFMTMNITITDRMVEKFESVTTPAGTFECVKITYTNQSSMGAAIPINVDGSGAEWLAKDTGMVRSEQYDKNKNLSSYTLLTEFSR